MRTRYACHSSSSTDQGLRSLLLGSCQIVGYTSSKAGWNRVEAWSHVGHVCLWAPGISGPGGNRTRAVALTADVAAATQNHRRFLVTGGLVRRRQQRDGRRAAQSSEVSLVGNIVPEPVRGGCTFALCVLCPTTSASRIDIHSDT